MYASKRSIGIVLKPVTVKAENMKKILLFIVMLCMGAWANATVQRTNLQISSALNKKNCTYATKCNALSKFYAKRHYSPVWIKNRALTPSGAALVHALHDANVDGLDPRSYHIKQIDIMLGALSKDRLEPALITALDISLTDGLLRYLSNLVYGLHSGRKLHPLWPVTTKTLDVQVVADKIAKVATVADLDKILLDLAPKYPGYAKLREKLVDYYAIAKQGGWEKIPDGEEILRNGVEGDRVLSLQKRLYVSGELSEIDNPSEFDDELEQAVVKYQENNGLSNDGVVDKSTLHSLNRPVEDRIRQIELNMDRMRTLPDNYPERYVIINIPDYSLKAFESGKVELFSDVIVGKPNRQTCILNSQIITLELNPYWNIPASIVKEYLPEMKADPKYFTKNGIKIFSVSSDNKYKEVNPKDINWQNTTDTIFNLRFREDPGANNALGRFKFIFDNNCGIYLHDSLAQAEFERSKRGLSHGCVRVAEVDALANYLLKTNSNWDESRIKTELSSSQHRFIKLSKPTQVYIIYLTAWYDADEDFVQFRDDIYHFDKLTDYPLYLPAKS